jgi:hypothetical protein
MIVGVRLWRVTTTQPPIYLPFLLLFPSASSRPGCTQSILNV